MKRVRVGNEWLASRAVVTDTIAPRGVCELCGSRTPQCLTGDRAYLRYCSVRHGNIAASLRRAGHVLDGTWQERTSAGRVRR